MHARSPFQDVAELPWPPGRHTVDTRVPSWLSNAGDLSCIDPQLQLQLQQQTPSPDLDLDLDPDLNLEYVDTYLARPAGVTPFPLAYDPAAHGFALPTPPTRTLAWDGPRESVDLAHGWADPHDHHHHPPYRHWSPVDPSGLTFSSTDSSVGEYALTPSALRDPADGVGPAAEPSGTVPGAWSSLTSLGLKLSPSLSPLIQAHHRSLSLKDLQVTPDPELPDERDALHPRISLVQELDLSDQGPSALNAPAGRFDPGALSWAKDEDDDGAEAVTPDRDSDRDGDADAGHDSEYVPAQSSARRSTRTPRRRSRAVAVSGARVHKPDPARCTGVAESRSKGKRLTVKRVEAGKKYFPCTFHHYGCEGAFANKNEWKRHVASQHLQLGIYRCDMGSCAPEYAQQRGHNDFNRKDLFTQHCRRMHAPWVASGRPDDAVSKKDKNQFEKQLDHIRARCWVERRQPPPRSQCGFCGERFTDEAGVRAGAKSSWEERMEHVGRHLEKEDVQREHEAIDDGLHQWALHEGLIEPGVRKGQWWLVGMERVKSNPDDGGDDDEHSDTDAEAEED